ncbi:hypothetical protein AB0D04_14140 [Streptomyces sp. NPDC048483]|uniref:hypothetical protein n=1 Tax=Streptomyces sp. NPDC048483 TaxID=3154927 RepID=UPI0034479E0D
MTLPGHGGSQLRGTEEALHTRLPPPYASGMADLHELLLTLDLPDGLPSQDLTLLRRHLDEELLSSRGPAARIGGTLIVDLRRSPHGWAPTARQEVHPDEFPELQDPLTWLAGRTTTTGAIGHRRFYENDVPHGS